MQVLDQKTLESSELVEQTFEFWFNDHEHIRSPFPKYLRGKLKNEATELFFVWANGLHAKAKDELNEEIISEKFEEIIFEKALSMVRSEDEKITILYPFLPRVGDKTQGDDKGDSIIKKRAIVKEKDHSFLKLVMTALQSKETWETQIELPV